MTNTIRIAGIVEESIVDGPGIRLVVFVQGCKHKCPGCHNVHTHAFDGGEIISVKNIIDKIKENPLLDGITLSGGEPFEQAKILSKLAKEVKDLGYNVMTYTGYTYEQIVKSSSDIYGWSELLENTDILVDGKFDVQKKNLKLRFKGSENQRIIDVKETKLNNKIVFANI